VRLNQNGIFHYRSFPRHSTVYVESWEQCFPQSKTCGCATVATKTIDRLRLLSFSLKAINWNTKLTTFVTSNLLCASTRMDFFVTTAYHNIPQSTLRAMLRARKKGQVKETGGENRKGRSSRGQAEKKRGRGWLKRRRRDQNQKIWEESHFNFTELFDLLCVSHFGSKK
jgi:hypothetical protein